MPRAVVRFLALAIPTALVVLAAVDAGATAAGLGPDLAPLAARAVARIEPLSPGLQTAIVAFEATALVALFLLVEGRSGSLLADGVVAGFAAWLFRGPLLVASVALMTRLPTVPFWQVARIGLVSLPAAGFAVGMVARLDRRSRSGEETVAEPPEPTAAQPTAAQSAPEPPPTVDPVDAPDASGPWAP